MVALQRREVVDRVPVGVLARVVVQKLIRLGSRGPAHHVAKSEDPDRSLVALGEQKVLLMACLPGQCCRPIPTDGLIVRIPYRCPGSSRARVGKPKAKQT